MFRESLSVNISIKMIENICKRLDIDLKDSHKSILTVLISGVVFKDGSIIILSETINQVTRVIKKHNEKIDFVNILLGLNCISTIDKYGAITIPISALLNKLMIKREIIGSTPDKYLNKKVLTNATQTLCVCEVLQALGIPKIISIPVVNLIFEWCYSDIDKERKMMIQSNVAFKGHKLSKIEKVLIEMQLEKVFLSTAILLIITELGFKLSSSLILVSVISELYNVLLSEYKKNTAKSFLKQGV